MQVKQDNITQKQQQKQTKKTRESDRQTDRDTERDRDRETDKARARERKSERQRHRERETETERDRDREREKTTHKSMIATLWCYYHPHRRHDSVTLLLVLAYRPMPPQSAFQSSPPTVIGWSSRSCGTAPTPAPTCPAGSGLCPAAAATLTRAELDPRRPEPKHC